MFTISVGNFHLLQADTALAPRSLCLSGDQLLAQQGVEQGRIHRDVVRQRLVILHHRFSAA
jgi:hypothetical protein